MTYETKEQSNKSEVIANISTDRLFPNPSQPRFIFEDEPLLRLADSIKRHGVLQPLSVRPASNQTYQIIAGERRWRAARIAGLNHVPCIVLDIDTKKSAELALIENIQREDLNIFEQAAAIASLIDIYGLTQEQAAKQLSSSQSHIANRLRILKLTPPERAEIISSKLTERHARALLRLNDPKTRLEAIRHIKTCDLNVSDSEKYIDRLICSPPRRNQHTKGNLKDLRLFFNTIDRASKLLCSCGYDTVLTKTSNDTHTSLTITIKHKSFT